MENVCRVCCCADANLANIYFCPENSKEPCVADMLLECVDCNLRADDSFPKQICAGCVIATQVAFKFKRKYEESHKRFCELLKNLEKGDEFQITDCHTSVEESQEDEEEFILGPGGNELEVESVKKEMDEADNEERECDAKDIGDSIKIEVEESQIQEPVENGMQEDSEEDGGDTIDLTNEQHQDKALSDGKPEICQACGSELPNKIKLILHLLTHAKDNHNQCPCCGKTFTYRNSLRRHIHVHSDEKPHKCPHCPKAYKFKEYLTRHVRLHSEDRFMKCHLCDKTFSNSTNLKNHIRSHSPVDTDPCPDCH